MSSSYKLVSVDAANKKITLDVAPPPGLRGWLIIDAFHSQAASPYSLCEICKIVSIAGAVVTLDRAPKHDHKDSLVLWVADAVWNVAYFGAKGDGVAPDSNALQAAINDAQRAENESARVVFPSDGVYRIHDVGGISANSPSVTRSNITIDVQGALLIGPPGANSRPCVIFNGETAFGASAESDFEKRWRDCALQNVWFKNARIGSANDDLNKLQGPEFKFCVDSGMENVIKKGSGGTAFDIGRCRRVVARNCINYGNAPDSFGFLIHVSDDCLLDNCAVLDGPSYYAFQIKGGRNNVLRDCLVRNVDPISSKTRPSFRDRGDAPWSASPTTGLPYPYEGLGWNVADDRRASHNSRFINCRVEGSTSAAFVSQESIGTTFENCSHDNKAISGFSVIRLANGKERDFAIINPRSEGTVMGSGISAVGTPDNLLPGVQILGGYVRGSFKEGLSLEHCDSPFVHGVDVKG